VSTFDRVFSASHVQLGAGFGIDVVMRLQLRMSLLQIVWPYCRWHVSRTGSFGGCRVTPAAAGYEPSCKLRVYNVRLAIAGAAHHAI